MGNTAFENQTRTNLVPISTISIPNLFALVKKYDKEFNWSKTHKQIYC